MFPSFGLIFLEKYLTLYRILSLNITDNMDFKTFSITYIYGRIYAISIKIKYHAVTAAVAQWVRS